ncbi:DsbA family protein [Alphaproteobacteria bacterium]|nr:DsbA family protein [Alphaproteobacteria bacterium]
MKIKTLQIFTDYVCPWCYLGQARLKKVISKYKIKLDIIHFPLHPDTPKEGLNLLDLFGCSKEELNQKNSMMKKLMNEENLEYNFREFTYNSRLAQELGYWAQLKYKNDLIHDELYKSYFIDKKNVYEINILLNAASRARLPQQEAKEILEKRTYKNIIDKHWEYSYKTGITGVPTYILGTRYLVGAQQEKNFHELFEKENIERL